MTILAYREHPPAPDLAPYVLCYWSLDSVAEPSAPPASHLVLPDGSIDILFDDSSSEPLTIVGNMTRPVSALISGGTRLFGVRFRPGAARAFVRFPLHEITDQRIDLGAFWQDAGEVADRLSGALDGGRAAAIERSLRRRLSSGADQRVRAAIGLVTHTMGKIPVQALCGHLTISRQQLNRQFREQVGIGPKMFARIVRLQGLVERVRANQAGGWAALAVESGYFDQAHMISEFRELTGLTPTEFFRP